LIRDGIDHLRGLGERFVVVVGHPDYYPRFGFSTASARSLESPFPPGVLMALPLMPGVLEGIEGRVRYPRAFGL
jgi:putative acetyltransferase